MRNEFITNSQAIHFEYLFFYDLGASKI